MKKIPVVGAAMRISCISDHLNFLTEKERPLEIQDFRSDKLLDGDWQSAADMALQLLGGNKNKIGIHGPSVDLTIAAEDAKIRELVNKRFHQALDVVEILNAVYMVVHSPFSAWMNHNVVNDPKQEDRIIDRFMSTMGDVIKRAENIGVVIVIENVQDKDPFSRVRMAQKINSPAVAVSIDTGHAQFAHCVTGAPPVDYFALAAGDLLRHVHLQDTDGYADRHWQIGRGGINWHAVFAPLRSLKQSPYIILELRNKADIQPSLEFLIAEGLAQ